MSNSSCPVHNQLMSPNIPLTKTECLLYHFLQEQSELHHWSLVCSWGSVDGDNSHSAVMQLQGAPVPLWWGASKWRWDYCQEQEQRRWYWGFELVASTWPVAVVEMLHKGLFTQVSTWHEMVVSALKVSFVSPTTLCKWVFIDLTVDFQRIPKWGARSGLNFQEIEFLAQKSMILWRLQLSSLTQVPDAPPSSWMRQRHKCMSWWWQVVGVNTLRIDRAGKIDTGCFKDWTWSYLPVGEGAVPWAEQYRFSC